MIRGWRHRFPEGGYISWQCPRAIDEAYPVWKETRRLELRGVPFGLRPWQHLEEIVGHVGALQKILCIGLQSGNPNYIWADVEVSVDSVIPMTIPLAGGWEAQVILVAELPPPSERSTCPYLPNTSESPAPKKLAAVNPVLAATLTRDAYSKVLASPGQVVAPGPVDTSRQSPPCACTGHRGANINSLPYRHGCKNGGYGCKCGPFWRGDI